MSTWPLFALALLQGISEIFPISSLGHSILVPALLAWPLDRQADWFLPFLVVLHAGTALALVLYFWRDWVRLLGAVWRSRGNLHDPASRLFWLLLIASLPAGVAGLLLEQPLRHLFSGFASVAVILMVNGLLLLWGDRLKPPQASPMLETLSWKRALGIGLAQMLALVPGLSRSGVTLVAGVAAGLDYAASARFSFLLATPLILAASGLEVPKLLRYSRVIPLEVSVAAGLLAGLAVYLSTWLLQRYFQRQEASQELRPFGLYCLLLGLGALVVQSL
ncbi:MAG: undecaprenyl-diphosphate phosphatase [Candidatus Competibacteraceae bacterium]